MTWKREEFRQLILPFELLLKTISSPPTLDTFKVCSLHHMIMIIIKCRLISFDGRTKCLIRNVYRIGQESPTFFLR